MSELIFASNNIPSVELAESKLLPSVDEGKYLVSFTLFLYVASDFTTGVRMFIANIIPICFNLPAILIAGFILDVQYAKVLK